jgi:acyl-CoA thioesterase
MNNMMDKEKLLKYFEADAYVKLSGIEIIDVTKEQTTVRAEIKKEHLNANGFVQGGMLYTMADFAFAVHSNYLHPMTVTQCGHINYIRPAKTAVITATAMETTRAGHTSLCEVVIRDEQGEIVCVCNFNGFVKDVDEHY